MADVHMEAGWWMAPHELPRCPCRFAASTLRMPALAGNGQPIDVDAFAVGAAILAALWHRAVATRMCALVGFLCGHEASLASLADQFGLLRFHLDEKHFERLLAEVLF